MEADRGQRIEGTDDEVRRMKKTEQEFAGEWRVIARLLFVGRAPLTLCYWITEQSVDRCVRKLLTIRVR